MPVNSLGQAKPEPGNGKQGPSGRGISSFSFVDNNDGSVTITVNMDDGTTEGPFTGTLISDNLIALNKLSLTGTALADKLEVLNADNTSAFYVDTLNGIIYLKGTVTVDSGPLRLNGLTGGQLAQTDGSKNLVSSNNLPASCSATNMTLTTPTIASASLLGTTATSLTASRVLQTDSSGNLSASAVSTTTLGYLDATSSVQTQLNGKQPTLTGATTTVASSNLTPSVVVVSDGSGKLASSSVSTTTLSYLDATSSIQAQLNAKNGTISVGNNQIVQTNGSGAVIGSTTLPSGSAATNMTLTTPSISSPTITGTTNEQTVVIKPSSDGTCLSVKDTSNSDIVTVDTLTPKLTSNALVWIQGANNNNKFQVLNNSSSALFQVDTTDNKISLNSTTISCPNLTASRVVQTDASSYLTASNTLTGVTLAGTTNCSGLTASQIVQTDGSKNLTSSNTLTGMTLAGTTNVSGLTASQLVQTDSSKNLTTSNTLPSSCSATSMTLNFPTIASATMSGTTTTSAITASGNVGVQGSNSSVKLSVSDNSSNLIFNVNTTTKALITYNNTLDNGSGNMTCAGTFTNSSLSSGVAQINASRQLTSSNTLTGVTLSGTTNVSDLTASRIVQTDGSKNLTSSNTLTGITLAGTNNLSSLSASQIVQTDGSKNMTSSNTLPSSCSATNMTLTTPTFSGTSTTGLLQPSSNNASDLGVTGTRYRTGYFYTSLELNNSSGSGNWAFANIRGKYAGNITSGMINLYNDDTSANSGSSMIFNGTNGSAVAKAATLKHTGSAFQVIADTGGVTLSNGGTSWGAISARNQKNVIDSSVDHERNIELLDAIPIDRWSYKFDEENTQNMGPYAEDIQQNFNLGNGKELSTLELDGVLFSCLKGMYIKHKKLELLVTQQAETIASLQADLTLVKNQLGI